MGTWTKDRKEGSMLDSYMDQAEFYVPTKETRRLERERDVGDNHLIRETHFRLANRRTRAELEFNFISRLDFEI